MAENKHQSSRGRGKHFKKHDGSSSGGHDVTLSKALSYLLRHGAPKENVKIHPGGYIDIDDILSLPKFSRWSVEGIRSVVDNNDKQRFTIRTDTVRGKAQICANQGHSFQVEEQDLQPIENASEFPTVVHGTYARCWESIKASGLRRMNRIHIHFAPGEPGEEGVISGMRSSAQIYIYVDLEKALKDGIKFYRSRNNVILTPGNEEGTLASKYFTKVINVRTKEVLQF